MVLTAALFGYLKPRYYLMDRKNNTLVYQLVEDPGDFSDHPDYYVYTFDCWQRRAIPGDIIAIRPLGHPWTEIERKHFLIVELEGIDEREAETIVEPVWDLDSYKEYEGLEFDDWYALTYAKALSAANPDKALQILKDKQDSIYFAYIEAMKDRCRYPVKSLKKRRFQMQLDDLGKLGVDLELMMDEQVLYAPRIRTGKYDYFDKLKDRYIESGDGLNWIAPRTDEEIVK